MRWSPGTKPITKEGFRHAWRGYIPAKPDNKDYMKGYRDGQKVREVAETWKRERLDG